MKNKIKRTLMEMKVNNYSWEPLVQSGSHDIYLKMYWSLSDYSARPILPEPEMD